MSKQELGTGIELEIPRVSGDPLSHILKPGDLIFVVGANGSGKSALIQHLASIRPNANFWRIPAHRQSWVHSDSVDITARDRLSYDTNQLHQDREDEARWTDHFSRERQSAILFDLVNAENLRARTIALHVDNQEIDGARKTAATNASPFKRINDLLRIGTLSVSLEYSSFERVLARHQSADEPYGLAQLSDGERSAAMLAARVLTVNPGTILLIDEPERHLHPSISKPFLSALVGSRLDCAFLVSTNDLDLAAAHSESSVLMVRSCRWHGNKGDAWEIELLRPDMALPKDLKKAVLGSRKRILFVEGDNSKSLDFPLYKALFPDVSIVPKGGCNEVLRAVNGLRGSEDLHHVEAFGLIDRDDRTDEDVKELASGYVFALDVCSVESLYYCSDAIAAVAQRQAETFLEDATDYIEKANKSAMKAFEKCDLRKRVVAKHCERQVRNRVISELPTWEAIMAHGEDSICVQFSSPLGEENKILETLIKNQDLNGLIARYPLRKSNVFDEIARSIKFSQRKEYEQALLSRIQADENLAQKLKRRIEPLAKALER